MAGIQETKDALVTLAKLGNAVGSALEDGSIGITDAALLLPVIISLPTAISGADQIPAEVADLDEAEKAELVLAFVYEFDIPQDEAEVKIEAAVKFAVALAEFAGVMFKKGQ